MIREGGLACSPVSVGDEMEERVEQHKGFKVKIRGDLAMYDKRMERGDTDEARGGIAEVIESGEMAPVVFSKHHRDPRTKMHNAVNKIRKFVNERPEHCEAGFKTKAAFDRHFGSAIGKTQKAQKISNKSRKLDDDPPMCGRVPGVIFRRKVREAGGAEVLKDDREVKRLFKDYLF